MKTVITSWLNTPTDGGAWLAQHRLRHEIFIDRLDYQVQSRQTLEFDQFDTPSATYVVVMDGPDALACCRLIPTTEATMVATLWPQLLGGFDMARVGYLEATRIGVSANLSSAQRRRALDAVIQATLDHADDQNIKGIVGVMPRALFRASLERNGCQIRYLADAIDIDGKPTIAGLIDVHASLVTRADHTLKMAS